MAFTDIDGKIILAAFGDMPVLLGAACDIGDILGVGTDNFILGDEDTGPVPGLVVALEQGVSGQTIHGALAAVVQAPPAAGVQQYWCPATDIGDPLYLSATGGKASGSQGGTTVQTVGHILSRTVILLAPGQYLTGDTQTLSGALTVGGVTGLSDTVTVATNKKIQLRDTGIFIQSSADGKLTISSDGVGLDDIILAGNIQFDHALLSSGVKSAAVSADKTLAIVDCGVIQLVDTDGKKITLPSTAVGLCFTIMNNGEDGAVAVTIDPAAADKISGALATPVDNKDLINTKATAKRGDYVKLIADAADGYMITEMVGIWARE